MLLKFENGFQSSREKKRKRRNSRGRKLENPEKMRFLFSFSFHFSSNHWKTESWIGHRTPNSKLLQTSNCIYNICVYVTRVWLCPTSDDAHFVDWTWRRTVQATTSNEIKSWNKMKTNLVIFPHNIDGMEGAVAVSFTLHSIMFTLTVMSSVVKARLEFPTIWHPIIELVFIYLRVSLV